MQRQRIMRSLMTMARMVPSLALALAAAGPALAADGAQAPTLTDEEIAHIVVTANKVDIDAGKLGQSKAKSKDVKAFAKQMVTDHSAVNKQAADLAKKLKVVPKENAVSKSLQEGGDSNLKNLKTMKGAEFDKSYVDHEVTYHQAVLDAIDNTLVPNAKNEELKGLIVKVRPAIAAHLDHAKQLQSQLK